MVFLRTSNEITLLTHLPFTCFRALRSTLGAEADVVQNVAANFTPELRLDTCNLVRHRTPIDRNKSMTGITMEEVSVWSRFAVKVPICSVARAEHRKRIYTIDLLEIVQRPIHGREVNVEPAASVYLLRTQRRFDGVNRLKNLFPRFGVAGAHLNLLYKTRMVCILCQL
jgi:hypothetical protein